ncbi:MAG: PP2C family protein-serine/threonine phosphatase, partial [Acidimicrobiales bacterium]
MTEQNNPTPENWPANTGTHLRFGARTDVGRVRAGNEDSHRVCTNGAVVCDGLGGHNAGQIASDTAAAVIAAEIERGITTPEQLAEAVQLANLAVYTDAQSNPLFQGMGTTAVAIVNLPGDVPRVA